MVKLIIFFSFIWSLGLFHIILITLINWFLFQKFQLTDCFLLRKRIELIVQVAQKF